jgi:hypothetical protein
MTVPSEDDLGDLALPEDDDLRTDPDIEPPDDEFPDEVELVEDPDVATARDLASEADPLVTDELRPEEEVLEFDPPDDPSTPTDAQITVADNRRGESLDERLEQEEPDVS